MKKIFFLTLFSILTISVFSQKVSKQLIAEYEDTLKVMAHTIMNGENQTVKTEANNAFIFTLQEVLQFERSFNYPFDSLKTISIKTSSDSKVRIYTWLLKKDNGSYQYFGFVHYKNKSKKRYEIITLNDNSENIRRPENEQLDNNNWYGALYYDIIYIKKKGRKYYTLLGWDGNNDISTKKIIDVMYFSGREKIKFGASIFKKGKTTTKRFIIEYNATSTISVRYEEKEKRIVFDHLIPMRKDLEGLHEYYIPDGTYNALKYTNGKWELKNDVAANNPSSKNPAREKPKMGITPD
ncbi:MAG TPA: hypothetical protein EYQ06_05565 [Flavobacteriales bacterium]|nr:hypothetical protein [Flavobacteriales bacterium]HIK63109.1 hypothetical protein [Flavobacteriales bacterium]